MREQTGPASVPAGRKLVWVAGQQDRAAVAALVASLLRAGGDDVGHVLGQRPLDGRDCYETGSAAARFVVDAGVAAECPIELGDLGRSVVLLMDAAEPTIASLSPLDGLASLPNDALLVANVGDPGVPPLLEPVSCRVVPFSLMRETPGALSVPWCASAGLPRGDLQPFQLFVGGSRGGTLFSTLPGDAGVRCALAAVALVAELGVPLEAIRAALPSCFAVAGCRELVGEAAGVKVYLEAPVEDARVALCSLRSRHPQAYLTAAWISTDLPRPSLRCVASVLGLADMTLWVTEGHLDGVAARFAKRLRAGDVVLLLSRQAVVPSADRLVAELVPRLG